MWELVKFYYPKLDDLDISRLLEKSSQLSYEGFNVVFCEGNKIPYKGKGINYNYLETAIDIYRYLGIDDFYRWHSLVLEISNINSFCLSGFLKSSIIFIEKSNISCLEDWVILGISINEKNGRIPVSYFTYTADVFVSVNFGEFKKLFDNALQLSNFDIKIAETYFENLSSFVHLLSIDDLDDFSTLIFLLLETDNSTAIELIISAKEVFTSISSDKIPELFTSFKQLAKIDTSLAIALFDNAPFLMKNLTVTDFKHFVSTVANIAKGNSSVAESFLTESSKISKFMNVNKLSEWSDVGTGLIPEDAEASKAFFMYSLANYDLLIKNLDGCGRKLLLDTGARLSLLNQKILDDYFKNATFIFQLITEDKFKEWAEIGAKISEQNTIFGSGYYRNSKNVLENIDQVYYDDVLKTASKLLAKDWILVGAFFEYLPEVLKNIHPDNISQWANVGIEVYDKCKKVAVNYFENSPKLLSNLDLIELREWALKGVEVYKENQYHGGLYFSLMSYKSLEFINQLTKGASLKEIKKTLEYFALGFSGIPFKICSINSLFNTDNFENLNPVIYGNLIYLPPNIKIFNNYEDNLAFYRLSVVHEIGHRFFTTFEYPFDEVSRAIKSYNFDLLDCMEYSVRTENLDLSDVVAKFPCSLLSSCIFGIIEDARVEYKMMNHYRGLARDFERLKKGLLVNTRKIPERGIEKYLEWLLHVSLKFEPDFGIDTDILNLTKYSHNLLDKKIFQSNSSTLDSFEVTIDIYNLIVQMPEFQEFTGAFHNLEYRAEFVKTSDIITKNDNLPDYKTTADNLIPDEYSTEVEEKIDEISDKQNEPLVENKWNVIGSYRYGEWDIRYGDYKPGWCVLYEIEPFSESNKYYTESLNLYRYEISHIKRIFKNIKPVTFQKLRKQPDGSEIDFDAFTDALMERKCGTNPDDNLYLKIVKQERDVATLFLIDVSASTQKELIDNEKRIIDVERDALIIMSQALESLGDKYAVYAFSGKSRENVEYFSIKDFDEGFSNETEHRISALKPMSNTRLGTAIRHSMNKLEQVEAKTKIMILLSDGEPYDFGLRGDMYRGYIAEEDTKKAIMEGKAKGIHSFCITVDKEAGNYLDNIFSDSGYIIIDDAKLIPERLPSIYKKITT
jgi:Mg-chelatase subunit ChlD